VWISITVCATELVLLLLAAYVDHTYWLSRPNVGLFYHPGIFSILIGDVLLFSLSTYAVRLTRKVGAKLPNRNPKLVRRYYRTIVLRNSFSNPNYFVQLFLAFALVGFFALITQSIKLLNPFLYYGHDTFDSYVHVYSFAANRLNLFISWCLVLPMFFAYLIIHIASTNRTLRATRKASLLLFRVNHPDKSGGYAFFGFANTLYTLGLVIVLLEVFLLIYTHDVVSLSNVLALLMVAAAFVLISFYSVREVSNVIKRLESDLKARGYIDRSKDNSSIDLYFFTVVYQTNFSAYNHLSFKAIAALRAVSFFPALFKLLQYSGQIPN